MSRLPHLGIVVVSLVVLSGGSGTISLGQFAIVGVGAVVAGNVIVKANLDFLRAASPAAVGGARRALVIGLPALRVRPLFLAVTTLLFAAAMDKFVLNPANFPGWIPGNVGRPVLWKRYPLSSETHDVLVILGVLVLVDDRVVRVLRVGPTRTGDAGQSRDNERAAAAMAIPVVTRTRSRAWRSRARSPASAARSPACSRPASARRASLPRRACSCSRWRSSVG